MGKRKRGSGPFSGGEKGEGEKSAQGRKTKKEGSEICGILLLSLSIPLGQHLHTRTEARHGSLQLVCLPVNSPRQLFRKLERGGGKGGGVGGG